MKTLNSKAVLIAALLLTCCSGYDRESFRMEAGKKYALKKWPDSAFIDTLDRYFANEPVRQPRKQKVDISMNMGAKAMSLPKENPKQLEKKTGKPSRSASVAKETQSFPDRFFNALTKLSENSNNKEFGRKYKARGGETLDDLLLRVYGPQARRIPKSITEGFLRGLNPGVDFSSLSEGEMVLLPEVK